MRSTSSSDRSESFESNEQLLGPVDNRGELVLATIIIVVVAVVLQEYFPKLFFLTVDVALQIKEEEEK